MNYSVSRLPEVWGTFSTTGKRVAKGTGAKYANDLAKKYAGKPKELANFIYGNRLGKDHKIVKEFDIVKDPYSEGWVLIFMCERWF